MYSDDTFLEKLVLKGGSAIDLFHPSAGRASIDLDFSIDGDFDEDIDALCDRFRGLLATTFNAEGLNVFDIVLKAQPPKPQNDFPFWGGYSLEFKVTDTKMPVENSGRQRTSTTKQDERTLQNLRTKRAIDVGPGMLKTFRIEFSKHEYCLAKEERELDGYTVYVNTPLAIAAEKLRAICQQAPSYREVMHSRPGTARPRDFFDVHFLTELYSLDWSSAEAKELVRMMFDAKKVPFGLLDEIEAQRALHGHGYSSLQQTVRPGHKLKRFDFYFDYVLALIEKLKPFRDV